MSTQAKAVLTGTIILGAFIPTPAGGHPTWNEFRDNHVDLTTVIEPIAPHRADLLEKVLRAREWMRTRRAYREIEQRFQRRRARAVSPVPTPAVEPVIPAAWVAVATIRAVFGAYGDQAVVVATCESTLSTEAVNGQYLGLFQMGTTERAMYGHGESAYEQAQAAYAYFLASGSNWSPWACRP